MPRRLRLRRPSKRWLNLLWFIIPIGLIVALAWFFNDRDEQFARSQARDRDAYAAEIDRLEIQLSGVVALLGEEQAATTARGEEPVTPPVEQIVGERGLPGAAGERGRTGATGAAGQPGEDALTAPCTTTPPNFCVGPPGQPGQPGVGATGATGSRGPVGEQGAAGPQGPAGDSIVGPAGAQGDQGPAGPGPTDAQLDAAVARYCAARNGCAGPQGPPGPGVPLPL